MKIAYITSIDTDLHRASSNQVSSMIRAFKEHCDKGFVSCVLTRNKRKKNIDYFYNVDFIINRKIRKFVTPLLFFNIIKKENVSHIYCREIFVAFFYSILGYHVFFELHEMIGNKVQDFFLKIISKRKSFNIITVSKKAAVDVSISFPNSKVICLPNGVFIEDYDTKFLSDKKLLDDNGKLNIVYTGSLYKGNDIDIIVSVAERFNNGNFYIIGGTKPEFESILINHPGAKNIKHIPSLPHNQVIYYQLSADVLFYPISDTNRIKNHTSPLKIFEYMAACKPILANSLGAVNELLNETNAYIFSDFNDAVNKLDEIDLNIKNKMESKSIKAFEYVRDNYTWKNRVINIIEIGSNNVY
ncbi:glycosyltransferase [Vibrio sp. Vb2535]|uniref:glycosyltransferase n=1 Tax=Vibrio TaxID=662 RepID=UPI002964EA4E|nr:glycosyltransferase [Vibrio sp. Vb2535]MDW1755879.1 glycosyltransferase [Vibrio sp. Vb2535]